MVRRGWYQMEVPSGWVQVLRGPQPRAEKWPSATQKRGSTEIPNSNGEVAPTIRAVTRGSPRTWTRDTALQEARRRVVSLEAALQAMGDFQGPEVDVLKNALSRAKQAAQTRPLQNDAFIQRSQKRIASLERTRRRTGVVGQGSGSARTVETGGAAAEPVPAKVPCRSRARRCCSSGRRWPNWKRNESRIQSEGPSTLQRACGCG